MEIRELTLEHIEAVKPLMLEIFSGPPWNDTWTDERLHAYLSELMGNGNSLSLGLYWDGELIGMALGRVRKWYEGDEFWIDEFGIRPGMQQGGVGSAFLSGIEKLAAERGIRHLVLLTERGFPAYHFYLKNGFEEKKGTVFFSKTIEEIH